MATTGIWKVSNRLDNVIRYTTNIDKVTKTSKETYLSIHNLKEYENSNFNEEKQLFVSGINCSIDSAYKEMLQTKKRFNKTNGIVGFHAFQSFKEGEVTPEIAHEIGIKIAEEIWGDRFEVLVSTHLNTKHIHNHFVINSVSFVDGKRYYDKRSTYAELRRVSDSICDEYGLSVLEEKACKKSKINYANYYMKNISSNNYYSTAIKDLDRAIGMAYSYSDFEKLMKAMDYELIYRANKLSIRRSPYKKNIRIERYFGDEYKIERIKERITEEQITRIPFIEEYSNKRKFNRSTYYNRAKKKGIYSLALYYCYLLKVFPKKYPYQKLSSSIRIDIEKMEQISKETRLLVRNNLKTDEQFFNYKKNKELELDTLEDKRDKLWYRHKKATTFIEQSNIKKEIEIINKSLKNVREDVRLCDGILNRLPTINKNLKEFSEEREEVKSHEHIK